MLAGVSLTWYTWLEQGRRINASRDVLVAIGRALRLDDAGLEHLLSLAEPGTAGVVDVPATPPAPLERLLDALMPAPAYVLGPRWEFLAWNGAQERLYPRLPTLEPPRRNLLWVLFADPFTRELIVDWDIHARQALAEFRSATSAVRHDPAMIDLVEMLRQESEDFDRWWPEHDVSGFETRLRRFNHPTAGELTFQYQQLTPAGMAQPARGRPARDPRRRLRATSRGPPLPGVSPARAPRSGAEHVEDVEDFVATRRVGALAGDDDRRRDVGDLDGGDERGESTRAGQIRPAPLRHPEAARPCRHQRSDERVASADRVDDRSGRWPRRDRHDAALVMDRAGRCSGGHDDGPDAGGEEIVDRHIVAEEGEVLVARLHHVGAARRPRRGSSGSAPDRRSQRDGRSRRSRRWSRRRRRRGVREPSPPSVRARAPAHR